MTSSPANPALSHSRADDEDFDCSSIQIEQPDLLAQMNARYDMVLEQIDELDLRIQRLLGEISGENSPKFGGESIPS